jgi:hypothetical protein
MDQRYRWLFILILLLSVWSSSVLASTIKLQWDAPTLNADGTPLTDLTGYRITFCVGGTCNPNVGGTDISPDLGLVTTYLHTGRTPGTDYRYVIRAKNTGGDLSAFSYQAEGRAPPGDLVGLWFRNDTGASTTVADGGWFGLNGQLCQGVTCPLQGPTWVTGKINTALHCDGSNDHADIPSNALLNTTGDMSVAFWLRLLSTTNVSTNAVIASKEDQVGDGEAPLVLFLNTLATPHLNWYHHTTGGDFSTNVSFTADTIPLNTWRHVVITRTVTSPARTLRLWINGTEIANACGGACTWAATDGPGGNTEPLHFCVGSALASTSYANVDLDEFRLYDYALSQTEITSIALAPAAPGGVRLQ